MWAAITSLACSRVLELVAPDAAFLELGEPALDERLRLGVAVAAAVGDPERAEQHAEPTCGERRAVVGAERQRSRCDRLLAGGALDDRHRLDRAAARLESEADDLAR
jgi:hypothetical protein